MIFSLVFWHSSSSSGIFGICTVKKKREEKESEETEDDGEKVEFEKDVKKLGTVTCLLGTETITKSLNEVRNLDMAYLKAPKSFIWLSPVLQSLIISSCIY